MKKEKSLILAIVITVFCFIRCANATFLGTVENSSGNGALGELSSMVFSLSYPQDDDWESVLAFLGLLHQNKRHQQDVSCY